LQRGTQDFTAGGIMSRLILFALPMLVGNVFQQLYSMVDAVIVGRYVGGQALAAVGASGAALNFLIATMMGLATGASVTVSQFFGAKEQDNLQKAVSTSVSFLLGLAFCVSALGYAFMPGIMRLLSVGEDVFTDTVAYMRTLIFGIVFIAMYNAFDAFLRAVGDSRTPLVFLIFSAFLNVGLDWLFVAVFRWGVRGAAAATVLSQASSVLPMYALIARTKPLLRITRLRLDLTMLRTVLRYSIPAAVQLSTVSFASLTIMRLVNTFGSSATAGYASAVKLDSLALMPSSSISMATAVFVGQNMGAGLEKRARRGLGAAMVFMVGVALAISAVLIVFGAPLMSLFMKRDDPRYDEIIAVGVGYLRVIAAFYFLHSTLFAFNGFFRGAGDAVIVMALTISSLAIRSVTAHLLVRYASMGPEAVAWSIPVGWLVTSLAGFLYYRAGFWRGKTVARARGQKEES